MQEKLWKVSGFWAMGLMLFMATMIIIRWVVDFITWSPLDSGWVQAIGSIAAIIGSFALARYQGKETERQRGIERLDRDAEQAAVCVWLANDTFACLASLERKIGGRLGRRGRVIGDERLHQLQQTLLTFAGRDIHPLLMREIAVMQREVAYSLTAVRQLGRCEASETRLDGARKRAQKVRECKGRLDRIVIRFRKLADDSKF